MIKLLGILCILGVVRSIPVPDEDDFRYMIKNVNPNIQTYSAGNEVRQPAVNFNAPIFEVDDDTFDSDDDARIIFNSAQPQATVVRQPGVVNNVQPSVQTYSAVNEVRQPAVVSFNAPFFKVDDDTFDFDDDSRRIFNSAQPQDTVVRQPGVVNNVQPSVQTFRDVNEVRQPAVVSFNAPFFKVDDDTFDSDDDSRRIFNSAQPQDTVVRQSGVVNNVQPNIQTYSAGNEVRQPAVVRFNAPIFEVDDDTFDFDDDSRRIFNSAQPQATVVRQPGVVNNVQPSTYSANMFRIDDDRYDFDDDDIRFVHAAQPKPTVMTYSANTVANRNYGQPITKTAETASETRPHKLTVRSIPSTYQSIVVNPDFDDDNSGEVFFRSFTPTDGNRAIAYSRFRDQSAEFEDFNDDAFRKTYFVSL